MKNFTIPVRKKKPISLKKKISYIFPKKLTIFAKRSSQIHLAAILNTPIFYVLAKLKKSFMMCLIRF